MCIFHEIPLVEANVCAGETDPVLFFPKPYKTQVLLLVFRVLVVVFTTTATITVMSVIIRENEKLPFGKRVENIFHLYKQGLPK